MEGYNLWWWSQGKTAKCFHCSIACYWTSHSEIKLLNHPDRAITQQQLETRSAEQQCVHYRREMTSSSCLCATGGSLWRKALDVSGTINKGSISCGWWGANCISTLCLSEGKNSASVFMYVLFFITQTQRNLHINKFRSPCSSLLFNSYAEEDA